MNSSSVTSKSISPPLWTPSFILMSIINLFMSAGSFLLIPVLPLYAREFMGASEAEIGYVVGIYTLSALFLRPIAGLSLDNLGRKPTYLFGLLFFTVCMPFYAWTTAIVPLLILRLVHGLSWGVVTTGGNTIASDIVPPQRRGEGIGYFGMSFTVAMALGPVLGLILIQQISYSSLFYVSSGIVAATFILANWVKYPQIAKNKGKIRFSKSMLYDARVVPASLLALACSAVYGGLISFITLFMEETGIKTGSPILDSGAIFFIVYAIGLTVVRPYAGKYMDRQGPRSVLAFGFSFLILGLILLASSPNIYIFILASLICGMGMGVIFPTVITMVVNLVPPERRGVANSTFFSAVDIGVGVGTILLGNLASLTSITIMYYSCAGIIVLPALFFFFFVNQDYRKKMALLKAE